MDWVEGLRGQLVALDTAPIIYFIERHPAYILRMRAFFQALDRREFRAVTSTVTLLEVLVLPFRVGNSALLRQYREILLDAAGLTIVPVSTVVAEEAARIRATHNLRAVDAIQLAVASLAEASVFLTNDLRFPRLANPRVIMLDEL